jgi:hypothetical protein
MSCCRESLVPHYQVSYSSHPPALRCGRRGLQWEENKTKRSAERIYRPSIYLDVSDGYWFWGLTNTNGSVPMMTPDPEMTFNKIAITSLLIGRFSNGPLGPFDYVRPVVSLSSCCSSGAPGGLVLDL